LLTWKFTFEPELVHKFKNAPAPLPSKPLELASFGIKVDKRPVSTFIKPGESSPPSLDEFLQHSFKFKLSASLLGRVAAYHRGYCYEMNNIGSPEALQLADLLGHLVDSAKNGYSFSESDFDKWKRKRKLPKDVQIPAYQEAADKWKIESTVSPMSSRRASLQRQEAAVELNPNEAHPLDHLFFKILKPHIEETMVQVDGFLFPPNREDDFFPFTSIFEKLFEPLNDTKPKQLQELEKAAKVWEEGDAQLRSGNATYNERISLVRKHFENFQCSALEKALQRAWSPLMPGAPSIWRLVKAAFFASVYRGHKEFMFEVFFKELCYLQACSVKGTRHIVENIWAQMKPKKLIIMHEYDRGIMADFADHAIEQDSHLDLEFDTEFLDSDDYFED
jgi:RNA dependent RNA polymerase